MHDVSEVEAKRLPCTQCCVIFRLRIFLQASAIHFHPKDEGHTTSVNFHPPSAPKVPNPESLLFGNLVSRVRVPQNYIFIPNYLKV